MERSECSHPQIGVKEMMEVYLMTDVCYSTLGGLESLDISYDIWSFNPFTHNSYPLEQENGHAGVKLKYSDLIEFFFILLFRLFSLVLFYINTNNRKLTNFYTLFVTH